MKAKDQIKLRGESAARTGVAVLTEGADKVVYDQGGKKEEVEGWRVLAILRDGTPPELGDAAVRASSGDVQGAEKLLAELAARPGAPAWLAVEAGWLEANVRRVRARLEGKGQKEAQTKLEAWLAKHGDHRLAPQAALAAAEAALEAGDPAAARAHAGRLVDGPLAKGPWKLLGRVAQARATTRAEPARAATDLEAVEKEALEHEWGHEAAQRARISRAEALGAAGKPDEGARLLTEVVDLEPWAGTPARARALNVLGDLCEAMAGKDEAAGALAAYPFRLRVIRYATDDPAERARALGGAVRGARAAGQTELVETLGQELRARFPTSVWAK